MMEILDIWTRCLLFSGVAKNFDATTHLYALARATQEYYTTKLYTGNARAGLEQLKAKYKLHTDADGHMIRALARALDKDMQSKYINKHGRIDYDNYKWVDSTVMATGLWHDGKYLEPRPALPLISAQALLAMRQR